MEKVRMLVAVVLSILVFLLWQMLFVDSKKEKPGAPNIPAIEAEKNREIDTEIPSSPPKPIPDETYKTAETITVDTPLYKVQISEKGATFKSFKLKDYRETIEKDSPPKELINPEIYMGTLQNGFERHSVPGLSEAVYTAGINSKDVTVKENYITVPFLWRSKDGVVFEKAYTFWPDTYRIELSINVSNKSDQVLQDKMTLSMMDTIPKTKTRLGFIGPSAMVDGRVEELKGKKQGENKEIGYSGNYSGNILWVAFQEQYFMSSIMPNPEENDTVGFYMVDNQLLESRIVLNEKRIEPNESARSTVQIYFGPKNISILKGIGHRLEKAVNFGWFDFLARPFLWVMNFLYRFIPNYGVTIILLTILIKVILWPLGNKSYKSMKQMKKMQPLMADIRERYKDDKQRMNMELMSLYKTYKVNPLGGCLPTLAQIPVFFAFYRMLYQAVELRHAPFVGWINDLSAPDRLFHFSFHIPFMQAPYGIPVLTIIMGATMLIQQKMQPPMGDPAQAKMMMLMPIVFTVIFVNFSSGLVLYWLVNNILSILQQYYVSKKTT